MFCLEFSGVNQNQNPKDCRGVLKKDVLNHIEKLGWESRPINKTFWSAADVPPLPEKRQSKVERK